MNHDWIGEIPDHWEKQRIKNIFHLIKNPSDSPESENILSLTMNGIVKRDISSNEGQLPETYNGYTKILINDIVINPMDLKSGWVDKSGYSGIISPSYFVLNKNITKTSIGYFTYQLQRHYKEKIFFSFGQGVSYEYRWGLSRETLLNFPIVVPPFKEQQQISDYLDYKTSKIDTFIEKTQQKIELLKEQRTSLINTTVTKGLNPDVEMKDSGVEWIGEIPKHWSLKKITHVINMMGSGTTPKSDNKKYYEDGNINWLVTGDLNDDYIFHTSNKITQKALDELSSLKIYPENSLLIAMYGATIGKLGILKIETTVNQATCVLNFDDLNSVDFWFYVFLGNRNYLVSLGYGGGQPNISQDVIKGLRFPSPPTLDEQLLIVNKIRSILINHDEIIRVENTRIKLLREYRQSLISSVVTGKVRVTEDMV